MSAAESANDFIEFQVQGAGVAILGVLDEEDDEEGNDGGCGVYYQLPGIGVVIVRAQETP